MEGSTFDSRLREAITARIAELEDQRTRLLAEVKRYQGIADQLLPPAADVSELPAMLAPADGGEKVRVAIPGVAMDRVYGVLRAARDAGNGATVDELAKATGYSLAHVKVITRELGKAGYLRDAGRTPTRAKVWAVA